MKFENTPGGKLVEELRQATREIVVVPNSCLPNELHDKVRGGRTLSYLERVCGKQDDETQHSKEKKIKARNVERLAAQVESKTIRNGHGDFVDLDSALDYSDNECDDLRLTKNMQALIGGMISGGILDFDDLKEN
jgi:hypothetical protein